MSLNRDNVQKCNNTKKNMSEATWGDRHYDVADVVLALEKIADTLDGIAGHQKYVGGQLWELRRELAEYSRKNSTAK